MGERWLLAEPGQIVPGAVVDLDQTECHHAAAVLRLRAGDEIVLADGRGAVADAVLRELVRGRGRAEVTGLRTTVAAGPAGVTLLPCVMAGRGMDWTVQKAVEIGVARLWPVVAGRSQLSVKAATQRLGHWRKIARQALKQCHRAWGMELVAPAPIAAVFAAERTPGAIADPHGSDVWRLPEDALSQLLVGPEGGLLPVEEAAARRHGWSPVRLGPHVLRAETAAIAGAALLAAESARRGHV